MEFAFIGNQQVEGQLCRFFVCELNFLTSSSNLDIFACSKCVSRTVIACIFYLIAYSQLLYESYYQYGESKAICLKYKYPKCDNDNDCTQKWIMRHGATCVVRVKNNGPRCKPSVGFAIGARCLDSRQCIYGASCIGGVCRARYARGEAAAAASASASASASTSASTPTGTNPTYSPKMRKILGRDKVTGKLVYENIVRPYHFTLNDAEISTLVKKGKKSKMAILGALAEKNGFSFFDVAKDTEFKAAADKIHERMKLLFPSF